MSTKRNEGNCHPSLFALELEDARGIQAAQSHVCLEASRGSAAVVLDLLVVPFLPFHLSSVARVAGEEGGLVPG